MSKRINLEEKQVWKELDTGFDYTVVAKSGLNVVLGSADHPERVSDYRKLKYSTLKKYYKLVA